MMMTKLQADIRITSREDTELRLEDGSWHIVGDITERSQFHRLSVESGARVAFDFSGVRTISSAGLVEWFRFLETSGVVPIYRNCPPPLVMHFNLVAELTARQCYIESFQIPSYCHTCGLAVIYTVYCGQDYWPGEVFAFNPPKCFDGACEIDLDVDLESYTYFIEELLPES